VISIGPLADGRHYSYDTSMDEWSDEEGAAYRLPFDFPEGRPGRVYFDANAHAWIDSNGVELPITLGLAVQKAFKSRYGINGEVVMFMLE